MFVKRIKLYIKAKRKIHDNVSHKEHRIRSLQPHSLFLNPSQILTLPSPHNCHNSTMNQPRTGRCEENGRKLCCK